MRHLFWPVFLLVLTTIAQAATIRVPAKQPTIQSAINAANNGDIVLVGPGTYFENINFDGSRLNSVVIFNNGEGLSSVLQGFTIQNGSASLWGGGVNVDNASPTITGNIITKNTACADGGGMSLRSSAALVEGNTISNNISSECTGPFGAGISVLGSTATAGPQIINNVIEDNSTDSDGGGIELNGAGPTMLSGNVIRNNVATFGSGGGIWIVNVTDVVMVQNLIYNNAASYGSGIYFLLPSSEHNLVLVNNTIVGSILATQGGSAVYAAGFDDQVQFFNNLMIGGSGTNAVYCDSQIPPTFTNNDAYSPFGSGMQGTCSAQSGTNGNIQADPKFTSSAVFHLRAKSPAIDAGDNSAPNLPPLDLIGKPRVVDGNGDGTAVVDMGAYEYQPPVK